MSKKTATTNPWFLCGEDFPDEFIDKFAETLCPPLMVSDFDLKHFSRQVLGSHSLNLMAKNRVFESLPTLSRFQCDELQKVFADETHAFQKLGHEYQMVMRLSAATIIGACALSAYRGAGFADAKQETAMIKAMGKKKRALNPKTRSFLYMALQTPVIKYVYGKPSQRKAPAPINSPFEI